LDTVLVNGKILSPKKVELIKSLLEQYDWFPGHDSN
jgi:hypothetical protein